MEIGAHSSSIIGDLVRFGEGCTIGPYSILEGRIALGAGSSIGTFCHLGLPTGETGANLTIGPRALVRSHSVIYAGATIGADLSTGHRVSIRETAVLGDDVQIGTDSEVDRDVRIGNHTRLHSKVFAPAGTQIGSYCWLFPGVILTNDPHPPSDTCTKGPVLEDHVVVGAGAIVLPGLVLSSGCVIAAGSVVTHDVGAGRIVAGSPARDRGPASEVRCKAGVLDPVYPWSGRFSRGYKGV